MAGDVIREFLVELGYSVDERGERRFVQGLETATRSALALGATITGLLATVTKLAQGMDELYYASQRTGAAVENIRATSYAVSQLGGSADGAAASLENVARFMRTSPGANSLIQSLGVQTAGANGQLRDTTDILRDLGTQFRAMPYWQANVYAGVLGIDERTLMALREGVGQFSDDYHMMYVRAGIDAQAAARDSRDYMREIRALGAAFQILGDKVAASLTRRMAGDIHRFRETLVANFGRISLVLETVAKVILTVTDVIGRLVVRGAELLGELVDWFGRLDDGSQRWAKGLGVVVAAWALLNTAFMRSPVGIILTLGAAILALYDDYQTWKAGGESLIDWAKWEPQVRAFLEALGQIATKIDEVVRAVGGENGWMMVFQGLLIFITGRWVLGILASIGRVGAALTGLSAPWWLLRLMGLGAAGFAIGMAPSAANAGETEELERLRSDPDAMARENGPARVQSPRASMWDQFRNHPRERIAGGAEPLTGMPNRVGRETQRAGPTSDPAVGPDGRRRSLSPEEFNSTYGGAADRVSERVGLSRDVVLAHWAHETGYGRGVPGRWNLGNIQALPGQDATQSTDRRPDGSSYRVGFRNFSSPDEFADAYAGLLERRYAGVRGARTGDEFARGLRVGQPMGYAEGHGATPEQRQRGYASYLQPHIERFRRTAPAPVAQVAREATAGLSAEDLMRAGRAGDAFFNPSNPGGQPFMPLGLRPSGGFGHTQSAGVTINQETTVTVSGTGDPAETARRVGSAQDRVNADLVRNTQGAAR